MARIGFTDKNNCYDDYTTYYLSLKYVIYPFFRYKNPNRLYAIEQIKYLL